MSCFLNRLILQPGGSALFTSMIEAYLGSQQGKVVLSACALDCFASLCISIYFFCLLGLFYYFYKAILMKK